MTRIAALFAAGALAVTPAWAQQPVSNEVPPEDAAPPPAAALVQPAETPAAPVDEPRMEAAAPEPQAAAPDIYQVLRTGDRQMSCDTLIGEVNSLTADLQTEQVAAAKAAKKAKAGRGIMGGAAGGLMAGAARYGLARGMIGGAISGPAANAIVAVTDSTSAAAGRAIASGGDDAPNAMASPKQQRLDHLRGLYREKQC
ncbi:MAG: hypothetical protein KA105_08540 [Caulobacter sp.]|nr:hypothetical protein [Caulobacter sp.]